jgi:hypothetical protein
LLVLAIAVSVLNNNFSFSRLSRAEFTNRLDRAVTASTGWTMGQFLPGSSGRFFTTDDGIELVRNSALAHMLVDCATMSENSRLRQFATSYWVNSDHPNLWAKLVDPTMTGFPLSDNDMAELEEYQHWFLYGISPTAVHLPAAEVADMFSPDKFRTGRATHQLFALYLYRKFNGDTPELDRTMGQIEERIATEADFDFRVTDLYLQRIAFLLAVGRPDLVKPRWVERALAAEQGDGGWLYGWHGWQPHPTSYEFSSEHSVAHASAQGMWLAYMLKYRYPEWVEKNYK